MEEQIKELTTWIETDFICKNLILNGPTDELYDYYNTMATTKEVWDVLQKKYDIDLITRLRIEKEARKHDQKEEVNAILRKKPTAVLKPDLELKGNKMKHGSNKQNNPQSRSTVQIVCYNCNKSRHLVRNCRNRTCPVAQENLIEDGLVATISEVNVIGGSEGWWLDTGAFHHVYHDLSLFRKYNEVKDKNILLGHHHTTKMVCIREVELKFTSDKMLVLKEVLHTPEIQKKLVSIYLLNKAGFTQTIGSDLFTLTKNNVLVRKGYATDDFVMFIKG
ncbi:putative Polyprotein [Cucumis melo var. makuwa]|uniref:Polyprotein n=1 Tax=Cucumis melo var. makuwa TaxID=1194695 RepID=A0A5A7VBE7_CUCMM|nr:putative Polyprotein [Cucumis melo var. makuwa]TYK16414.1 putative Polyprotein [Cucumis melo var. makuwa]